MTKFAEFNSHDESLRTYYEKHMRISIEVDGFIEAIL